MKDEEVRALRCHAEERLRAKTVEPQPPRTLEEAQRLAHELDVYRIELEMQNAELHQARDEAEKALQRFSDLYEFAPVAYITLDRNGDISAVNLAGAALLGIDRSRLIGRRFVSFVLPESRAEFIAFFDSVFASTTKVTGESALLKTADSPFFVQIEALAAPSGEECRFALMDITAHRQTEDALRQAKDAAEEAARAKNLFFANMSHELRTPMTGILGMLELALMENLDPQLRENLETTQKLSRSLLRTINDILELTKIQLGKLSLKEKPFCPRGCVTEAVDIVNPKVRQKGLGVVISVTEDIPEMLSGDHDRVRQVLINLIGNAVKFTDKGTVSVNVIAGGKTADGKREFTFAVSDTGIGVPENKRGILFQSFSQVDSSHSRKYGGTGLGLAISRAIVELMGGTISFESKEGVGSTCSFTIPLGVVGLETNAVCANEQLTSETESPVMDGESGARLLLAEDNQTTRDVISLMLKRLGYDLEVAEDGLQVVEMWEKGSYDLVLMDVQMPLLDGLEATRTIREKELKRGGHTPIVALTAHAFKEDELRCFDNGMDAHLTKPIDFKSCVEVIESLLNKKVAR